MSLPHERILALLAVRIFLCDLVDPKQTKRLPRAIRQQAYKLVKSFPTYFEIEELLDSKPCPPSLN